MTASSAAETVGAVYFTVTLPGPGETSSVTVTDVRQASRTARSSSSRVSVGTPATAGVKTGVGTLFAGIQPGSATSADVTATAGITADRSVVARDSDGIMVPV